MSYEIAYDRIAIRVAEDKYILLLQAGSNNCWEVTFRGERPEKNWFVYPVRDRANAPYITMAEFKKQISLESTAFTDENGYIETFKTRNRPWESKAYFAWLTTAMKKAETVEEISRRFNIEVSTHVKGDEGYINHAVIKTTAELVDYIENAKKVDGFICIDWELPRNITHPRKNPRNIRKVSNFYVVKDKYNYLYTKTTPRAVYSSRSMSDAKKFVSEKDAQRYIEKHDLQKRGFNIIELVEAEAYI